MRGRAFLGGHLPPGPAFQDPAAGARRSRDWTAVTGACRKLAGTKIKTRAAALAAALALALGQAHASPSAAPITAPQEAPEKGGNSVSEPAAPDASRLPENEKIQIQRYVDDPSEERDLSPEDREALHRVIGDPALDLASKAAAKRAFIASRRQRPPKGALAVGPVDGPDGEPVRDVDRIFKGAGDLGAVTVSSLLGIPVDDRDLTKLSPEEIRDDLKKLQGMLQVTQPLRIGNMFAVEAKPGNMIWFSQDGRYFFKGTMYDLFSGMKPLRNINDVREYALKTNYRRLRLDPDELSSAKIGSGPRHVVVYVDPEAEITRRIIADVLKYPQRADFTFWFVVVPSESEESKKLARTFYCAREAGNASVGNMLAKGTLKDAAYSYSDKDCTDYNWNKTVTAAYYTGVDVLPFYVGDDGRTSRGEPPQGLYNWLQEQAAADPGEMFNDPGREVKRRTMKAIEEKASFDAASMKAREAGARSRNKEPSASEIFPGAAEEEEEEELPVLGGKGAAGAAAAPVRKAGTEKQAGSARDTAPVSGGVYNSELSEDAQLHSGEVVKDPTQTVDLSGFDNSEEIRRYLQEARPSGGEALVVDGMDQSGTMEAAGSPQVRREAGRELSRPHISERAFDRDDKALVEEINSLRTQIQQVQNEYREKRQRARDDYDSDARRVARSWDSAMRDKMSAEMAARKRAEHEKLQNYYWSKYQAKLAELDAEEGRRVGGLSDQINFLKTSLEAGGAKIPD